MLKDGYEHTALDAAIDAKNIVSFLEDVFCEPPQDGLTRDGWCGLFNILQQMEGLLDVVIDGLSGPFDAHCQGEDGLQRRDAGLS